jgi:hypothetical protein
MDDKGKFLLELLLKLANDMQDYQKSNHAYGWSEYNEYIEFLEQELTAPSAEKEKE